MRTVISVPREDLELALRADASIGATASQLVAGWTAMERLRALLDTSEAESTDGLHPNYSLDRPDRYGELQRPLERVNLRNAKLMGNGKEFLSVNESGAVSLDLEDWNLCAPQKYDDTLLPFLALMRKELHANSHKGDREGWLRMTLEQALDEIRHHADKLIVPVMNHDREAIREHAADVANCAMMLADIAGVLSRE